jgi:shikimate kinase
MRISLIGMSNIGKSAWAQRISAAMGLVHFNCDLLIQNKLGGAVPHTGARGARDLAAWMGQPFDHQYSDNSLRYMHCEEAVLEDTFTTLKNDRSLPAVIDTTGSVIYTNLQTQSELRAQTKVIYFEASEGHIEDLFKHYIANPKPVIWGDIYKPLSDEEPQDTLRRCYPLLLRDRAIKYKNLAHIILPFEIHRNQKMDIRSYLEDMAL